MKKILGIILCILLFITFIFAIISLDYINYNVGLNNTYTQELKDSH